MELKPQTRLLLLQPIFNKNKKFYYGFNFLPITRYNA